MSVASGPRTATGPLALAAGEPRAGRHADRLVVGVIGHVDHGKSALVHALTGIDTDRLAEEKRRGISIALGFAHLAVPGPGDGAPGVIDLIDMPGHERFLRTMVSGASGMDAVLLVVAANEGVMPQTIEHVEIAALLGVRRAVLAISKADLADAARIALVARRATTLLDAAGIASSPPVATSARAGSGIAALRTALGALLATGGEGARDDGFCYLAIDRAFSLAGQGSVVTGTLRRGAIAVGDALDLLPAGRAVRVRGLEVRGGRRQRAEPGQRVAVNLRGVAPSDLNRGMALATAGLLRPGHWLTVILTPVPSAPRPLVTTERLRLLIGTAETEVRLRLLQAAELPPGESGMAQLHCAEALAVPAGERFILRQASPPLTLAGGRVLDPQATRLRRQDGPTLAWLELLARSPPEQIIRAAIAAAGRRGESLGRIAALAGLAPARVVAALQNGSVVIARDPAGQGSGQGRLMIDRAALETVATGVVDLLAAAAARHPLGLSEAQLAAALAARDTAVGAGVLAEAVALLLARGALRQEGGRVRLLNAEQERTRAQQEAALAAHLADRFRRAGLNPPDPEQLAGEDRQARRTLEALVRGHVLLRLPDRVQKREVLFHRDAVREAQRLLAPLLAPPGLLVREAGAALGISRKFSVPLLEYFDAIGFTRRIDDRRVLRQDATTSRGTPG